MNVTIIDLISMEKTAFDIDELSPEMLTAYDELINIKPGLQEVKNGIHLYIERAGSLIKFNVASLDGKFMVHNIGCLNTSGIYQAILYADAHLGWLKLHHKLNTGIEFNPTAYSVETLVKLTTDNQFIYTIPVIPPIEPEDVQACSDIQRYVFSRLYNSVPA